MLRVRTLHLLIWTALLVGFAGLARAQNPVTVYQEDFQGRVFWVNSPVPGSLQAGTNQWTVSREFQAVDNYPETPTQVGTAIVNPDCGYLHIHDSANRRNPRSAAYSPASASDRFATNNVRLCTRNLRDVEVSFWWAAGGSPTAWGEFHYSTDGGKTWTRYERAPGNFQYRNQATWTQETLRLPAFSGAADLRIGFRWVNQASGGNPGRSFAIDNIRVNGVQTEPANLPAIRVELDSTEYCRNNSILVRIVHDAPYYCNAANYAIEVSNAQGNFTGGTRRFDVPGGQLVSEATPFPITALLPADLFQTAPALPNGTCLRMRVVRTGAGFPVNVTGPESECFQLKDCGSGITIRSAIFSPDGGNPASTCDVGVLDVNFVSPGTYAVNNQYRIELSDANGSFERPLGIGSFTPPGGANPQPGIQGAGAYIAGNLPREGVAPGCGYRLRVIATAVNSMGLADTSAPFGPFCIRACDILTNVYEDIDHCAPESATSNLTVNFRSDRRLGRVTYPPSNTFRAQFARQEGFELITGADFPATVSEGRIDITLPSINDLINNYGMEPGAYYVRVRSTEGSDPADRAGSWVRFNLGLQLSDDPANVTLMTADMCAGTTSPFRVRINNYDSRRNSVYILRNPAGATALTFDDPTDFQPDGFIQFNFNMAGAPVNQDIVGWSIVEFNFNADCAEAVYPLVFRAVPCVDLKLHSVTMQPTLPTGDTLCLSNTPLEIRFSSSGFVSNGYVAVLSKGPDFANPILLDGGLGGTQVFPNCPAAQGGTFNARFPANASVEPGCDYYVRLRSPNPLYESASFGPFCITATRLCDIETNAAAPVVLCATDEPQDVRVVVRTNTYTKDVKYGPNNEFRVQFFDGQTLNMVADSDFNGVIEARGDTTMLLTFPSFDGLVGMGIQPNTVYYMRMYSTDPETYGTLVHFVYTRQLPTPDVVSLIDTICMDFSTGQAQFVMQFQILNHDPSLVDRYEFRSPVFGPNPINIPAGAVQPNGTVGIGPVGLPRGIPPLDIEYTITAIARPVNVVAGAPILGPPPALTPCNSSRSFHAEFTLTSCVSRVQLLTADRDQSICTGSAFDVGFFAPGNYFAENKFSVELSDADGNFANFRVLKTEALGEVVGDGVISIIGGQGRIEAQLPLDVPEGEGYRVRVRSRIPEGLVQTDNIYGPFTVKNCDVHTNLLADVEFCISKTGVITERVVTYETGKRTDVTYDPGSNEFAIEVLSPGGGGLVEVVPPGDLGGWLARTGSGEFNLEFLRYEDIVQQFGLEPNTTYYLRVVATAGSPADLVGGTLVRFRYQVTETELNVLVEPQTVCLPSLRPEGQTVAITLEGQIENYDPRTGSSYRLTATNLNGAAILSELAGSLTADGEFALGPINIPAGFIPWDMYLTIEELPGDQTDHLNCNLGRWTGLAVRMTNCVQTLQPYALQLRAAGAQEEICAGSAFDVRFVAPGVYPDNNRFRLELSDASGSFENQTPSQLLASVIGNGVMMPTDTSMIESRLPLGLTPSCNYFVRVIGTHPGAVSIEYGPFCVTRCDIRTNGQTDLAVCLPEGQAETIVEVPFTIGHDQNVYRPTNDFVAQIYRRTDMQFEFRGELEASLLNTNAAGTIQMKLPPYEEIVDKYGVIPNEVYYLRVVGTESDAEGLGTWIRLRFAPSGRPVVFEMIADTFCLGELPTNPPQTVQFYTFSGRILNHDPRRNSDYLLRSTFFGLSGLSGEFLLPAASIGADGFFSFNEALNRHPQQPRALGFEPLTYSITLQEIVRIPGCDSGAISAPQNVVLTNCTRIPQAPIMTRFEAAGDTLCMLSALDVTFTCLGVFPAANEYVLQLSDVNGNFTNPLELARIPGGNYTGGGAFRTFIPDNKARIPEGSGYRLRVATTTPPVLYFPLAPFSIKHCDITTNVNQATGAPEDLNLCLTPRQDSVSFNVAYRTGFSNDNVTYAANNDFRLQILNAATFAVVAEGRYGATRSTTSGSIRFTLPYNKQLQRVENLQPNTQYYLRVYHTASNRLAEHRVGSLVRFAYSTVNTLAGVELVTDTICLNQSPELPIGSAQQVAVQFYIQDYDRTRGNRYAFESNLTGAPIALGPGGIPIRNDGFVQILFNLPVNFLPNVMVATVRETGAIAACDGTRSTTFTIVFTNCVRTVQPFPTRNGADVCAGSAFDVTFAAPGNYPNLNTFVLEISDANGSFDSPLELLARQGGGLVAPADTGGVMPVRVGEFLARIPENLAPGTNYYVRVRSSQPVGRFTTWGPFTIKRCNIQTDPRDLITMCLFEDQGSTLELNFRADQFGSGVQYNANNRFVVELLERETMRVLLSGGDLGEMQGTGDGRITLEVPTPRVMKDLGIVDNEMYYLRIRATSSNQPTNNVGTLVRFVYTFRQRQLELKILQDTVCLYGPYLGQSNGFDIMQLNLPVQITNFDPTRETTYEFTFSFRNPNFERGYVTNSPNIIPYSQINTDGTVTLTFFDWVFQSQRGDYYVEVREFGEYSAACSGDPSVAQFFLMANCTETFQPVMERAAIFDTVCVNSVFDVPYGSHGLFAFDNVFELHLSDANGSFENYTVIGTREEFIPDLTRFGLPPGLIEGQIPNDVQPGCQYFIRVYSTSSGITSRPYVEPFGPFCIRQCDIATNNNETPFTMCVADGDTTTFDLPFSINNFDLESEYEAENLFAVQILDRQMNVLAEGRDIGQVRLGTPFDLNNPDDKDSTIRMIIPPFRELRDRFGITVNSVYYMRVTATKSSRMGDVLGTLIRMSVSSTSNDTPRVILVTPPQICLDGTPPLEFRIEPFDASKPTQYRVVAQFAGRPDIIVNLSSPADFDADGTARIGWVPTFSQQPLPTIAGQRLIFRVQEITACNVEAGGGPLSDEMQVDLVECTRIGQPVASRDQQGDTLCLGSVVDVPFTSVGLRGLDQFGAPLNDYTIELSDTTRKFNSGVLTLGTLRSSGAAGLIAGRIPDLIAGWPDTDPNLTRCDFLLRVASNVPNSPIMTEFGPFCLKKCDIRSNPQAGEPSERDILLCLSPSSTNEPLRVTYQINTYNTQPRQTYVNPNEFEIEILSTANFNRLVPTPEGRRIGSVTSITNGTINVTLPSISQLRSQYNLLPNTDYYLRIFASNGNDPDNLRGSLVRFAFAVVEQEGGPNVRTEVPGLTLCRTSINTPYSVVIEDFDFLRNSNYRFWMAPVTDTSETTLNNIRRDIEAGINANLRTGTLSTAQLTRRQVGTREIAIAEFPFVGGLATVGTWNVLTSGQYLVIFMREEVGVRAGSGCQSGVSRVIIIPINSGRRVRIQSEERPMLVCLGSERGFIADPHEDGNVYTWTRTMDRVGLTDSVTSGNFASPAYAFNDEGTGTIRMRAQNSCGVYLDEIRVIVSEPPQVSVEAETNDVCPGTRVKLVATNAIPGGVNWVWLPRYNIEIVPGRTNEATVWPDSTVTYTVTAFSGGCDDTATVTVNIKPAPQLPIQRTQDTLFVEEGHVAYQWFKDGIEIPGATNNWIYIGPPDGPGAGDYSVEVTFANGCVRRNEAQFFRPVGVTPPLTGMGELSLYPNPYRESTMLYYSLLKPANVRIEIFDLMGKRLAVLVEDELQGAGKYSYRFGAREMGFGSGVYLMKVSVNDESQTFRLIEVE